MQPALPRQKGRCGLPCHGLPLTVSRPSASPAASIRRACFHAFLLGHAHAFRDRVCG